MYIVVEMWQKSFVMFQEQSNINMKDEPDMRIVEGTGGMHPEPIAGK